MGGFGASYDAGNRVFSMVILQVHLALLWAAVGRRYKGYGIGAAIQVGVLIALASQILIWGATAGSYLAGVNTYFNYLEALNVTGPVAFGQAMVIRAGGLVANCVIAAVLAALGWLMGGLIPKAATQ